jgi:hypothetical protein
VTGQPLLEIGVGERSSQCQTVTRHKWDHHCVRCPGRDVGPDQCAVEVGFERLPIDHDQFTVEPVERSEARVAVFQQLANGHVAIERSRQQRLDRRGLKQLVVMGSCSQLAVAHQLDVKRTKKLKLAHVHSRDQPPSGPGGIEGPAIGSPKRLK